MKLGTSINILKNKKCTIAGQWEHYYLLCCCTVFWPRTACALQKFVLYLSITILFNVVKWLHHLNWMTSNEPKKFLSLEQDTSTSCPINASTSTTFFVFHCIHVHCCCRTAISIKKCYRYHVRVKKFDYCFFKWKLCLMLAKRLCHLIQQYHIILPGFNLKV